MDVNFYKILLGMLAFSNSYIIKAFTGKSNTKKCLEILPLYSNNNI